MIGMVLQDKGLVLILVNKMLCYLFANGKEIYQFKLILKMLNFQLNFV